MSEVGVTTMDNGVSKTGTSIFEGFTGRAFEPANEYKGDFARTYFYMATCYQDYTWLTDATGQYQITNGAYPSLQPWAINLLLKWSRQDPVSAKETTRNDKVYTLQQNRNPFIDYPDLAEYIWGTKTNVSFSTSGATNPPNISTSGGVNITSNAVLNFTNSKRTRDFTIAGRFLEGDITVNKSGTNADQFSVSITNIPKANATNGTSLSITYNPTAAGTHNATITLNSTSASPFVIQLIGTN
jgi:hypothetical protein